MEGMGYIITQTLETELWPMNLKNRKWQFCVRMRYEAYVCPGCDFCNPKFEKRCCSSSRVGTLSLPLKHSQTVLRGFPLPACSINATEFSVHMQSIPPSTKGCWTQWLCFHWLLDTAEIQTEHFTSLSHRHHCMCEFDGDLIRNGDSIRDFIRFCDGLSTWDERQGQWVLHSVFIQSGMEAVDANSFSDGQGQRDRHQSSLYRDQQRTK